MGQVRFRVKSANYYESYHPFFKLHFFAKNLHVVDDGPVRGHLCHTDTFLVSSVSSQSFLFLFLPCPSLSSLLLSRLSLFSLSLGDDKMTNKG